MTDPSTLEVLRGNTAFTNDLYRILSEETDGNVFFSPIGVHICLSMIYQGAQRVTADVLSKVLKVPNAEVTAKGYKSIMQQLNSTKNVTLLMANKIYVKERKDNPVVFIEEFKKRIIEDFFGDLQFIDFDKAQEAVDLINAWIEEKTQQKIQKMVNEQFVKKTTLMLINALYFKGLWSKKFDESSTTDQTFYVDEENTVEVKMMHNRSKFLFKSDEELEAKILQLPYEGDDISMIIILPFEKNGIKNLENKLYNKDLGEVIQHLHVCDVTLSLPRFKMQETMELETALKKMGLAIVFDEVKANFRGTIELSSIENLFISKVLQKSFVEVNEEGTEAAAATALKVVMKKKKIVYHIEEFHVDHPAIFMLVARHDSEINILFYGRLAVPKC